MRRIVGSMIHGMVLLGALSACGERDTSTFTEASGRAPSTITSSTDRPAIFATDTFARMLYDSNHGRALGLQQTVGPATLFLDWTTATAAGRVIIHYRVEAEPGWMLLPSALVEPTLTIGDGVALRPSSERGGEGSARHAEALAWWSATTPFSDDVIQLELTIPAVRVVPEGNPASPIAATPAAADLSATLSPTSTVADSPGQPTSDPTRGLPGPFHVTFEAPVVPEQSAPDPTRVGTLAGAALPDEAAVASWVVDTIDGKGGATVTVTRIVLLTLEAAMHRDQHNEWRQSASGVGDMDRPVWEVEVQNAMIPHSCYESGPGCYWDSRVLILDARTADVIGMRIPDDATPEP